MNNQKGAVPVLILLAGIGLLIFILVTNTFDFKDKLFNTLFPKPPSHAQEAKSVPDEILLKFKLGVTEDEQDKLKKTHGLKEVEKIDQIKVHLLKVPEQARDKVIEALNHNPNIEFAEPNFIAQAEDYPNDPYFKVGQWGPQKIQAPPTWDITKGNNSITIAIVDTGVKADHPDLSGKAINGYNFYNNTTDTSDVYGHGTEVTGIAAATTNNSQGIAGIGREDKIMPVRVCDNSGLCSYSNMAKGIMYAADNGAKVINISLGGSSGSSTLTTAVKYACGKGVVIAAAAGNSGGSPLYYPAAIDTADTKCLLAVGATDIDDSRAGFSSFGAGLDVMAPGVNILGTTNQGGYLNGNGTSFSTPHVAGLAALIWSVNPGFTNQQVADIITSSAVDLGTAGRDDQFGFGRIDAYAAIVCAKNGTLPCPKPSPVPPDIDGDGVPNESDCNPTNAKVYQTLNVARDVDQDGYTITTIASPQCVGSSTVVNNRTYYKDASPIGQFTWLATASATADCNDSNKNVYQTLNVTKDYDRDGYAVGTTGPQCVGTSTGWGWGGRTYYQDTTGWGSWLISAPLGTDCFDLNTKARPGQGNYYTTTRGTSAVGNDSAGNTWNSYDYNCNSTADLRYTTAPPTLPGPACYTTIQSGTAGWTSGSVPACGVSATFRRCTNYTVATTCTSTSCVSPSEACASSCGGTPISWSITDSPRVQACR